jgi:Pam16
VIIIGTQVVGRAFIQAYKQAAANSASGQGTLYSSSSLTRKTGITMEEACQILNVKKDSLVMDQVNKVSFENFREDCSLTDRAEIRSSVKDERS